MKEPCTPTDRGPTRLGASNFNTQNAPVPSAQTASLSQHVQTLRARHLLQRAHDEDPIEACGRQPGCSGVAPLVVDAAGAVLPARTRKLRTTQVNACDHCTGFPCQQRAVGASRSTTQRCDRLVRFDRKPAGELPATGGLATERPECPARERVVEWTGRAVQNLLNPTAVPRSAQRQSGKILRRGFSVRPAHAAAERAVGDAGSIPLRKSTSKPREFGRLRRLRPGHAVSLISPNSICNPRGSR